MARETDPATILRFTPRSFALRVHDQSMLGAGIQKSDIIVGEFTPTAHPGAIVVALIDGEPTIRRLILQDNRLRLVSENPNSSRLVPLSEVVIQGVGHTLIRRVCCGTGF